MALHLDAAESGTLELTPKTITTSRSAIRVMSEAELSDGRRFGTIRLSRLTWEDIEALYAAMRGSGCGPDWIRRCGTVGAAVGFEEGSQGHLAHEPAAPAQVTGS